VSGARQSAGGAALAFSALGAPLDSSGTDRGEARAPDALRRAGLVERLGARDLGDVVSPLTDSRRDPETGVVGFGELTTATLELATAVAAALARGERPLVLGGDCCLLLGVFAGLRRAGREAGLWFVDGHVDFYDGHSSPSGEAADMELAILTGHGPPGLVDIVGTPPLVSPERVMVLGHRRPEDDENAAEELGFLPTTVERLDARSIEERGPGRVGRDGEARLAASGPAWLHLDLDVLDAEALPALTYPQPGGLSWQTFVELVRPLAASPALVGLSVADFEPDRDPDGVHAARVVEALAGQILGASRSPAPAAPAPDRGA
jgi:arginase